MISDKKLDNPHPTLLKPISSPEAIVDYLLNYYAFQEYPKDVPVYVYLSIKGIITPNMAMKDWKEAPYREKAFNLNDVDVKQKMVEWYRSHTAYQYDHYHSVNAYKTMSRQEGDNCENVFDGRILHTESDNISSHAFNNFNLKPTYETESSPSRFYHFFELTMPLPAKKIKELNQRLSNLVGITEGGFDMSKVLRDFGSLNLKPKYCKDGVSPTVSELRMIGEIWTVEDLVPYPVNWTLFSICDISLLSL